MSEYSIQVTNILDGTLVPRMKQLVSSIALIEPYSIDSIDLKKRYEELCYLTVIYDYLYEYEVGEEEMTDELLLMVIRLIGNISINLQPEVFNPAANVQEQSTLFDVFIDDLPFTGTIIAGTHNIRVVYNGNSAVTKLIYNEKLVGAPGNTVLMQNAVFSVSKNAIMVFKAYGNNNILLTSAELPFEIYEPTRASNVLPTLGLPVTIER